MKVSLAAIQLVCIVLVCEASAPRNHHSPLIEYNQYVPKPKLAVIKFTLTNSGTENATLDHEDLAIVTEFNTLNIRLLAGSTSTTFVSLALRFDTSSSQQPGLHTYLIWIHGKHVAKKRDRGGEPKYRYWLDGIHINQYDTTSVILTSVNSEQSESPYRSNILPWLNNFLSNTSNPSNYRPIHMYVDVYKQSGQIPPQNEYIVRLRNKIPTHTFTRMVELTKNDVSDLYGTKSRTKFKLVA